MNLTPCRSSTSFQLPRHAIPGRDSICGNTSSETKQRRLRHADPGAGPEAGSCSSGVPRWPLKKNMFEIHQAVAGRMSRGWYRARRRARRIIRSESGRDERELRGAERGGRADDESRCDLERPAWLLPSGSMPRRRVARRCGAAIDAFSETRFRVRGRRVDHWRPGASRTTAWRGLEQTAFTWSCPPFEECLAEPARRAILRSSAAPVRGREATALAGWMDWTTSSWREIEGELGIRFHSALHRHRRRPSGGVDGTGAGATNSSTRNDALCLIAGVDSFLVAPTLACLRGESTACLTSAELQRLHPRRGRRRVLSLLGTGAESARSTSPATPAASASATGQEKATIDSEEPLRGDGMSQSLQRRLRRRGCTWDDIDYRITDANGEQYWFKEAALALDAYHANRKERL